MLQLLWDVSVLCVLKKSPDLSFIVDTLAKVTDLIGLQLSSLTNQTFRMPSPSEACVLHMWKRVVSVLGGECMCFPYLLLF